MSIQTAVPSTPATRVRSSRLLSVDLLRGLTIGFMILVNDPGGPAYGPLRHADWNGFTPTDLVFPTFVFLVGISTVFSTAKRLQEGATKASLILHVIRRSIILFLLCLVVNSSPFFHLSTMRYYGVLTRIALCYSIVATIYILSPGWRSKALMLIAALGGYWILMRFVAVPGYGVPGRDIPFLDGEANLAAWLDRHIFSAAHLLQVTHDPEGLLSTLPAIGTTLMGVLTGIWLRTSFPIAAKARGILIAGVSAVVLGCLWNFTFPINKQLWTSSYVLFAGGLSLLLLALFMWVADLSASKSTGSGKTFAHTTLLVFGTNAIFAYVLSEVLSNCLAAIHLRNGLNLTQWCYEGIYKAVPDAQLASLLYSLPYVLVCWLVVYFALYKRKIFLKV
jgi:predicted acyltransferase